MVGIISFFFLVSIPYLPPSTSSPISSTFPSPAHVTPGFLIFSGGSFLDLAQICGRLCNIENEDPISMEGLGDDLLGSVLDRIPESRDRKSCSEVCKKWKTVEGVTRSSARILEPELLRSFLPRFPNLVSLELSTRVSDSDLAFVGESCPRLKFLNLSARKLGSYCEDEGGKGGGNDFGDRGLSAISLRCRNLTVVSLKRRKGIADAGIVALVNAADNLRALDLSWCVNLTDRSFEAMGRLNSLETLILHGCSQVTDERLGFLSSGSLSRTLKRLDLSECDMITDVGVTLLRHMKLIELSLADCGLRITDAGAIAIADIHSLKKLSLAWLISLSDAAVMAISYKCFYLEELDLTGCELITGEGIRSFCTHKALGVLVIPSCYNVSANDVWKLMSECQFLKCVALDKSLRGWMLPLMQEKPSESCMVTWL